LIGIAELHVVVDAPADPELVAFVGRFEAQPVLPEDAQGVAAGSLLELLLELGQALLGGALLLRVLGGGVRARGEEGGGDQARTGGMVEEGGSCGDERCVVSGLRAARSRPRRWQRSCRGRRRRSRPRRGRRTARARAPTRIRREGSAAIQRASSGAALDAD